MADQEIAKHTRNIWAAMFTSEHRFWHKVREILLEIVIIVFAVSMSIWLHSVGEHRHEQAQVKTFLLGLKQDIQSDLDQISDIIAFHHDADTQYAYLASLDPSAPPDRDRFNTAYTRIFSNNYLVPRLARYEGFKSSGKLTNLENEALLEKIVNLYQYDIPKANSSTHGWMTEHDRLVAFIENSTEDDSLTARYRTLTSRKGKLLSEHAVTYHQLYARFQTVVDNGKAIIADIDKAYPTSAH